MRETGALPPFGNAPCGSQVATMTEVPITTAATVPAAQGGVCRPAPSAAAKGGARLPMTTTITAASDFPHHGFCAALRHRRHWMTGCRRPRQLACHQGLSRHPSLMPTARTGFRPVDYPLRLRVDDAFACSREDDKDWMDAWRTQKSCLASRHATLISHLYANRELAPEFLEQSPRRSLGLALRSDQRSWRLNDKLQSLSWNPGPAQGSDPSLLATHRTGPWHVICVQEGADFVPTVALRRTST